MATTNWDVIILGAGPAGLALARNLRPERRVLLIERQTHVAEGPRIGESLPGAASVLLRRLGLFEEFLAGPHRERGASLSIWDDVNPVWRDTLRDPSGLGWHLDRRAFDQLLRAGALQAGAVLMEGCRQLELERQTEGWCITLTATDESHCAPILIDATGRSASIARRLGVKLLSLDESLLCVYSFLACPADDEDACMRLQADEHGWWYSVQLPHQQRVLAYHLDAKNPLWRTWQTPADFIAYAQRHPLMAEVTQSLQPSQPLQYRPAGTAILDIATLHQAGPGFLAIGDALLTFDPISSQGLFHSLASAESAANAIRAGFPDNQQAFRRFQDEMCAVAERYLAHWRHTYQGPQRFSAYEFWSKRAQTHQ